MNTPLSYVSQLPELTSRARELQLSIEFLKLIYADAGSHKEAAWRMYNDAVDNDDPRHVIDSLFETAQMFDDICRGTWWELETAKKNLLALYN